MKHRQVAAFVGFMLFAACVEREPDRNAQAPDLHLWLYGADDLVASQVHPLQRGGASAIRLGEALRTCGINSFTVESHGLGGERVYLPSSKDDAVIVGCVARHVTFGFNASRITPAEYERGEEGSKVVPAYVR